jgi:hypothetical protein
MDDNLFENATEESILNVLGNLYNLSNDKKLKQFLNLIIDLRFSVIDEDVDLIKEKLYFLHEWFNENFQSISINEDESKGALSNIKQEAIDIFNINKLDYALPLRPNAMQYNMNQLLDQILQKKDKVKTLVNSVDLNYQHILAYELNLIDSENLKDVENIPKDLLQNVFNFLAKIAFAYDYVKELTNDQKLHINFDLDANYFGSFSSGLRPNPENATKHLYVDISTHGSCSVESVKGYNEQLFVPPKFDNFVYKRGAPVGSVNIGVKLDFNSLYNNFYVVEKEPNVKKVVKIDIPNYIDKYENNYRTEFIEQKNKIAETQPLFKDWNLEVQPDNNRNKYYVESRKKNLFNKIYENPKQLLDKTYVLDNKQDITNQIMFIVDRQPPILLDFNYIDKNDPTGQLLMYNKYDSMRESTKRKRTTNLKNKFTLSQLLNYIYWLGFRNVEVSDDSCSVLQDKSGKYLDPYKRDVKKRIKLYTDKNVGGRRRSQRRRSQRYRSQRYRSQRYRSQRYRSQRRRSQRRRT